MKTHELLNRYVIRQKSQYGVSMRALASRLKISPSFFSRILSGKKPIPYPLLLKFQKTLDIDNEVFEVIRSTHASNYLDGFTPIKTKGLHEVKTQLADWNLSEKDTNKVLRNWFFLPILEFTTLKRFDGTTTSIAKSLNLGAETVNVALTELKNLGLIEQKENGLWSKTQKKIRWSSATSQESIRRFHMHMMDKAKANLVLTSQDEFENRLITGITLTVSPKKIKIAKKRLNEFLHDIANSLIDEEDPSSEVYHLAIQFFPLSKK